MADGTQASGDEKGGTRREALAFPGIDPKTGRTIAIQLAYEKIKALPRLGVGKVKEAGYIVPEMLLKPKAIFEGLTTTRRTPHCPKGTPSAFTRD